MKCLSCDKILSDFEASRKYKQSSMFIDLCSNCLDGLDIETTDNPNLDSVIEFEQEIQYNG